MRRVTEREAASNLPAGEYVLLEVHDTGAGMSKQVLERIFEPFFTTKEEHGTGLGLSICYGIVKEAGGEIEAQSQPGQGSIFRVYLPVVPGIEGEEPAKTVVRSQGAERIMLVEDEPSLRFLVRSFLAESGYQVQGFAGAEPALACVQAEGAPDLLLTDIVMPGMSGPELVQVLHQRWPGLPVVYMSGYAMDTLERYGLDPEDIRLVQKPFSIQELAVQVRQALEAQPRVRARSY